MRFRYVFGPVPSRRLGRSLGVNLVPFKTCNYSCVYCQLGRTTRLVDGRDDFFPPKEVLSEIQEALSWNPALDYLTFTGEGEPTLCRSIGWLISRAKELSPVPVAVLTNGALLCRKDVREELRQADLVMPSLDAGDPRTFRRVNRPHRDLDIGAIVKGIARFREEFKGELWVEVMLMAGVNDTEEALEAIGRALERIQPDRTFINLPVRPPAEPWVRIPDEEALVRAQVLLKAELLPHEEEGKFGVEGFPDPVEAILHIIRRHPMRERHILETLSRFPQEAVSEGLDSLVESGQAKRITYQGQTFYAYAGGRYGR
ncbi:MAG TPA: radical SAM protein [Candidatus Latescibacteria bacterium]|nr:radical SAM protein [Candidatus Latescibacterota bacterium]